MDYKDLAQSCDALFVDWYGNWYIESALACSESYLTELYSLSNN
jgi:hypothetical protein